MSNESSYEAILNRMLNAIPNTLDKREGSVIYTAMAPTAMELARSYWLLGWLLNLMLPDTAVDEYLDKQVEQFGLYRIQATSATRIVLTKDSEGKPVNIPSESRFRINEIILKTTEEIEKGKYYAQVEQTGIVGNQFQGELLPIQNINSLGSAELLPDVIIEAQDKESDEDLRERFYDHVRRAPFGGNVSDYESKVMSINGVGSVQVFPIWDGPGSVYLSIGNENQREATSILVEQVQNVFQPRGNIYGGMAPIGHIVTVGTSKNLTINISATIKYKSGSSLEIIQERIKEEVSKYINSVPFKETAVYQSKVIVAILNVEGVIDVTSLLINGLSTNLLLEKSPSNYQTPVMGTITIIEAMVYGEN